MFSQKLFITVFCVVVATSLLLLFFIYHQNYRQSQEPLSVSQVFPENIGFQEVLGTVIDLSTEGFILKTDTSEITVIVEPDTVLYHSVIDTEENRVLMDTDMKYLQTGDTVAVLYNVLFQNLIHAEQIIIETKHTFESYTKDTSLHTSSVMGELVDFNETLKSLRIEFQNSSTSFAVDFVLAPNFSIYETSDLSEATNESARFDATAEDIVIGETVVLILADPVEMIVDAIVLKTN